MVGKIEKDVQRYTDVPCFLLDLCSTSPPLQQVKRVPKGKRRTVHVKVWCGEWKQEAKVAQDQVSTRLAVWSDPRSSGWRSECRTGHMSSTHIHTHMHAHAHAHTHTYNSVPLQERG